MSVLVTRTAPDFVAPAVLGNGEIVDEFKLSDALKDKFGILFFYPLDFTFVCPSELIAMDHRYDAFTKRNTEVIGVSIDSHFTHNAWRNMSIKAGGIGPVKYPLVADMTHNICQSFGVEHPEVGVALRAAFLIDTSFVVRAALINDLPIGRNVDELIRLVDALQFHEKYGDVCPANWQEGQVGMKASPEGVETFLSEHGESL